MDRAPPDLSPAAHSPSAGWPTSRTNRLRRSSRTPSQQPRSPATQAPAPCETAHPRHRNVMSPPPPAFKTPTRMARSNATVFCVESPNNDVEFQQDIVWDANSPPPVRAGKRGKSRAAGAAIGISEIVRIIAPMHGRPAVVEPALQEWIGENAAIPCTPEVQHPKRKSPRPNGVDDLLKPAKQFDFNMFQQDEEQAEDMHQQSLELLSEDILEYEIGFEEGPQLPRVDPSAPAPAAASEHPFPVRGLQDHNMEDDLELLFDEPTQRISGNFSQMGFLGSMETSGFSSGTAGIGPRCAIPPVSTPAEDGPAGHRLDDDWENDWENDDFLNDSLVTDMTQNPQCFAPPKHCSTQSDSVGPLPGSTYPSRGAPGRPGGCGGVAKNEPRMPKNRTTSKLDANPLSLHMTEAAASQASMSNVGPHTNLRAPQSEALSRKNPPISGSHLKGQSLPPGGAPSRPPAGPQPKTSLANAGAKRTSAVTTPVTSNKMKENQPVRSSNIQATANVGPSAARPRRQTPPVAPASDDYQDLDELFSSEPVWDEEGDDDLLCQMCEELETQAEVLERPAALKQPPSLAKKPGQTSQRPAPAAAPTRVGDQQKGHLDVKVLKHPSPSAPPPPPASPAARRLRSPEGVQPPPSAGSFANSFTGTALPSIKTTSMESFKYAPSEHSALRVSNVGNSQCYGGGPPPGARAGDTGQFTFKKPSSPSVKVIHTGPEKCSMAEIERKKRQALERRRQRLQGPQTLSAPTRGR